MTPDNTADRTLSPTCSPALDDAATRLAVTAERTLLAALEAGCSAPVGAYGEAAEGEHVQSCTCGPSSVLVDGSASVRLSATGPSTRLHGSAATSRPSCSPRVRQT